MSDRVTAAFSSINNWQAQCGETVLGDALSDEKETAVWRMMESLKGENPPATVAAQNYSRTHG